MYRSTRTLYPDPGKPVYGFIP